MANLIEYIQSQVYENSTEDISGSIMQQVLTRMASDEGVVNVHTISGQTPFADYNNAQAARDAVPAGFKKLGLIITYKLSSGWYIDEFIGSATSGWSTASNWKCLGPISVSQNASTGKTTITIGSESFDVATQPVSVSQNTLTIGGNYAGEVSTTYDVTLHNSGATFASLDALLSDADLATLIPTNVRKGGMSIKFVQTSDNKYLQARCMAQNFTTDVTQWQGVDDEPFDGSHNLAESGGINKKFTTLNIASESKAQLLHTYILNVFVIPKTAEFINAASISPLYVSLWSIRNSNLGGENSIIGLRLWMDNTYADYYTEIVPDIKTNGNIIKLEKVIPYGVFANGADVWIELNETADFNTATELISGGVDIKVSLLNNQQQALFNFISKTHESIENKAATLIVDVPSLSPLLLFKDTVADYRTLGKIASFDGNLFDKNHIINGYYMFQGVYYAVENYSAAYLPIPLEKGQTYSCNYASIVHFDILKEQDLTPVIHIAHGATDWSTTESDGVIKFTVPSNLGYDVCAVVSTLSSEVDSLIFNKGTQIKDKRFLVRIGEDENHYIIVDKQGRGDYTTLTEATNNAPDGSTIIVYPGVYDNECITAGTSKTLFIIGIDRDKCIIKNNLGDYQYSVIHISSGLLRNLTIIQEATSANDNGAYGVHADFNTGENSSLRIENCHLQSNVPNTGAIGIGLRQNMSLTIKGCRLVSGTSGRALYAHDGGECLSQYLRVIDSIIESPNQAIMIQGQATPELDFTKEQYYIEFVRNRIVGTCQFINWNTEHGSVTQDDFQGVRNLRLVATSWGNSASVLNAE